MNIEYLKLLEETPFHIGNPRSKNQGISIAEIEALEQTYNQNQPFPKVLKELIFLAGNYCYFLDYLITLSGEIRNPQQIELQKVFRRELEKYNQVLPKPMYCFSAFEKTQFMAIFLDEGDNPQVYNVCPIQGAEASPTSEEGLLTPLFFKTMTEMVNYYATLAKNGESLW